MAALPTPYETQGQADTLKRDSTWEKKIKDRASRFVMPGHSYCREAGGLCGIERLQVCFQNHRATLDNGNMRRLEVDVVDASGPIVVRASGGPS